MQGVNAVAWSDDELRRLNRAYRALSLCNGKIARASSEQELLVSLCETLVSVGGYALAWIGFTELSSFRIHPVAVAGDAAVKHYLDTIHVSWADDEHGRGPTGTAARTREPAINRDSGSNPEYGPWREQALQHGLRSSIALPLLYQGELLGVLTIYSSVPDAFDADELQLLMHVAENLAFALTALRAHDASTHLALSLRESDERFRKVSADYRHLEDQLRHAQKMEAIGRLAGGVAHDFNNLLSVILSYTHFMLDDLPPDSPLRADVEQIHRACTRATDLTRQLLAFSRQQVMQPRYLDLSQVIADMNKMLQRMLGADIELTLSLASDLGKVRADPSHIEQILMNLAVNARDAMPNGGRLSIETANVTVTTDELSAQLDIAPGRYVTLTVTDNGTGIDAATREHIFEPFFTTKEAGKGTGLGLSTVFGIVKQSGGGIYLDPEHEHGARFRVYLPSVDAERDEPVLPAHIPATLRGTETILLVEDDEQVRTLARAILQRQGYRVLDAQNAGEAFLLCESPETQVDLLLTDLVLPRMNGRELALRLRRTRPQLHVLFMSGYAQDLLESQTALDQSAFVQKPITPDMLLRKLREVLDATSARPQSTA